MTDQNEMREDWNRRALENARWYIASDSTSEEEFTRSGKHDVNFALRGLGEGALRRARTLEVGCGAGRMTQFLAQRVGHLTAIDVSTEMIELAKSRLGALHNVEFRATNGATLHEFSDGMFDLVLTYVVLQHMPKRFAREYFREFRRVLTPDGIFRGQISRIIDPDFIEPSESDTFNMRSWSLEELKAELVGWKSVEFETLAITPTTEHIWITAVVGS